MLRLFRKVPLRENYKDIEDEFVVLKAPPNISRGCFIFELSVAAAAFAISFYISFTSTVSVTSITYEPLDSPYVCRVLSPRSDSVSFSSQSDETAQFSSSRLTYDECITSLDTDGVDVCLDGNRQDYVLSLTGLYGRDSACYDLLLDDGFKFCSGSTEQLINSDYTTSFPTPLSEPTTQYQNTFMFFINEEHELFGFSALAGTVLSDYVAYNNSVYVVAESAQLKTYLYQFDPSLGSTSSDSLAVPVAVTELSVGSSVLVGLSIAAGVAHALVLDETFAQSSRLLSYSMATTTMKTTTVDCLGLVDDSYEGIYRFLSAAEDGTIVAMCGTGMQNDAYSFYTLDTASYTATKLHIDASELKIVDKAGTSMNDTVSSISTVHTTGDGRAYFSTGSPMFNLLEVDITAQPTARPTPQPSMSPTTALPTSAGPPPGPPGRRRRLNSPHEQQQFAEVWSGPGRMLQSPPDSSDPSADWVMQPVANLGYHSGSFLVQGYGSTIYLAAERGTTYDSGYYNITSQSFESYEDLRQDVFYAVAVELGYSFAVCDGVVLNSSTTIDPLISTSFRDTCASINGIYYQKNAFVTVPPSCAAAFALPNQTSLLPEVLDGCPALATIAANFTATTCPASFAKICSAAYTDNPPFSCTQEVNPDFLTTLGSALSNASALWSLLAVIISVSLRRIYPGGVLAREFDAKGVSKRAKASSGSGGKGGGRGSSQVYPMCQVDEDLEAPGVVVEKGVAVCEEGGPPEGCEMMSRGENGAAGEAGMAPAEGSKKKPKEQQTEEKEGCCAMLLDECDGC